MAAAATEARNQLIALINAEYAADGFTAEDDRIHDSLGHEGTRIGVTTEHITPHDVAVAQRIELQVRFYGYYDKMVDPTQSVSPSIVENYAERFQRACESNGASSTSKVWFFNVADIDFPDDPTGNKTRFVASIVAFGNNPSIVETSG